MFQTVRIYENSPKLKFKTNIVDVLFQSIKISGKNAAEVDAIGLILAETIFHPQGGGQPSDKGTINGQPVLLVNEDKSCDLPLKPIYHFIEFNVDTKKEFSINTPVTLEIDQSFRLQCARSHSAGHLIADILEFESIFSSYKAKAIRGHHFPGGEYVKVLINDIPENIPNFIKMINEILKEYINNNVDSSIKYNETGVRHIKFGDSERMCGGTHVNSTSEINNCEVIKIKQSKNSNGSDELTIFYHCP